MRRYAAGLLAAAAVLLIAAESISVGDPPLRLIAAAPSDGVREVLPGMIVARNTVARPDSILLTAPLTLTVAGQEKRFARGATLGAAGLEGLPAASPPGYCDAEEKGSVEKQMAGQLLFGLVGRLRSTKLDTRWCVFDGNGDGTLDLALLIGARGTPGRVPFAISPSPYALISGIPFGGQSEVRLRYAGPAGEDGQLAFDHELAGFGRSEPIGAGRHLLASTRLPATLKVEGLTLVVERYDPRRFAASLRVVRDFAPGPLRRPIDPEQR